MAELNLPCFAKPKRAIVWLFFFSMGNINENVKNTSTAVKMCPLSFSGCSKAVNLL